MHIFERGAVFKNSESGLEIPCAVLVADIFELNTDMKAMIMIDVDPYHNIFPDDTKTLEYMNSLQTCDIFNCEATAVGNSFRCNFEDITVDADYAQGSIIRVYIKVDDYEHHECIPIHNNYDAMVEIMEDESVWKDLK